MSIDLGFCNHYYSLDQYLLIPTLVALLVIMLLVAQQIQVNFPTMIPELVSKRHRM